MNGRRDNCVNKQPKQQQQQQKNPKQNNKQQQRPMNPTAVENITSKFWLNLLFQCPNWMVE